MTDFVIKHSNLSAFMLGTMSVLGFAPWYNVGIGVASLSGLIYLLLSVSERKQKFFLGYWFGFAHFALGFSWIGNALLVDVQRFGWLYPIVLILSGAFFGLFFAIPAVLSFYGKTMWQRWLLFGAWVVIFEWVRSFIFTGFPWNLLGYMLAFSDEMVQASSVGGSYFLSLVVVLGYSVFGLFLKLTERSKRLLIVGGTFLIVAVFWLFGYFRLQNIQNIDTGVVVRIVQPSIPQTMKWNREVLESNFDEYVELSNVVSGKIPDIIVWGETASPFSLDEDERHLQKLLPVLKKGSILAAGMITYQYSDGRYLPHNSMVLLDTNGDVIDYYNKSHLVPFGEYIPMRKYLPEFIKPIANAIGVFGRGKGPKVIKLPNLPSVGGIICYEAIFPSEVLNKNNRPDFLLNLTNDGWYGDSAGPYQHWVANKMRAVEEGIVIIRAANNGISGIIDPVGRVIDSIALNHKGFLDVKLVKSLGYNTLYSKYGNVLILTFCLILLFLGIIKFKRE